MKYKKMAEGGVADEGFDPEKQSLLNDWLAKDVGQRPGGNPAPQAPAPAVPEATDAHLTEESNDADTEKVADAHPGTQPDELTPYLKNEEAKVDKWGPEQEAAVMQHLLKSESSPGMALAKGAAGLGDAIMQGVARAGPGNFLSTMENREQNINKTVGELTPRLREANLKGMEIKEGLEGQSPKTPLGAANLPALRAVGGAYGMTPAQVDALAKSNPKAAMQMLEKYGEFASGKMKASIEQEMKMLEIQLQGKIAEGNQAIARQGKATEEQRTKTEAAKGLHDRGFMDKVFGLIPGTSANKATKALEGQLTGPAVGPQGAEVDKDGKHYVWVPETGKYHRTK